MRSVIGKIEGKRYTGYGLTYNFTDAVRANVVLPIFQVIQLGVKDKVEWIVMGATNKSVLRLIK